MKKTLVLLTCIAAVSAYSQGTVNFITRNTGAGVNAVAYYTNFSGTGPIATGARPNPTISVAADGFAWGGVNAKAGLYGAAAGAADLLLLAPSVGFKTGNQAGYVEPGSLTERTVPNAPGGTRGDFQVRAWDTGSAGVETYEAAVAISLQRKVYLGMSPVLPNILLGNDTSGGTPTLPANLTGLQPIAMDYVGVPEPSVIGLGILGAVAGLLVFRRRN